MIVMQESYAPEDFFNHISVLIPYRPSSGRDREIRERNFEWVHRRYELLFKGAEICMGEEGVEAEDDGVCLDSPEKESPGGRKMNPFSRAAAINDAARKATRDVFVITDADVFYDPLIIYNSVQHLDKNPWVIPYMRVHRLTEQSSHKILESDPGVPIRSCMMSLEDEERIDIDTAGYKYVSMLNIMPRSVFERVGGFDERFRGWGFEDDAFTIAVNTISGQYRRIDADIYHLWHPRPGVPKEFYMRSSILYDRYKDAEGDKDAMERLITERYSSDASGCGSSKSDFFGIRPVVGMRHVIWRLLKALGAVNSIFSKPRES